MGKHALPWTVLTQNADVIAYELSIDLYGRPLSTPTPRH